MALLISLTGSAGEFAVTPIFAIVCVAATYRLARQLSSAAVAALAAALLATNPSFLYQSVQPMSDVPVTGLWVACLVLLGGDRAWRWSAAGVRAGVAVLVRPNLVPLAAAAVLWGVAWLDGRSSDGTGRTEVLPHMGQWRRRLSRVALFALPVIGAAATIAWMQALWYGSATTSGYGTADQLFAAANIPGNASRYARWLLATNPIAAPLVIASLIGGAWTRWPSPRRASLALVTLVALPGCGKRSPGTSTQAASSGHSFPMTPSSWRCNTAARYGSTRDARPCAGT